MNDFEEGREGTNFSCLLLPYSLRFTPSVALSLAALSGQRCFWYAVMHIYPPTYTSTGTPMVAPRLESQLVLTAVDSLAVSKFAAYAWGHRSTRWSTSSSWAPSHAHSTPIALRLCISTFRQPVKPSNIGLGPLPLELILSTPGVACAGPYPSWQGKQQLCKFMHARP